MYSAGDHAENIHCTCKYLENSGANHRQGKRQVTISKHCGVSDAIATSRNKSKRRHKRPVIQHLWSGSHLLEEGGEKLEFKRQRGSLGSMEQAWLVTLDLGPCGPAATQQSAPVLTYFKINLNKLDFQVFK